MENKINTEDLSIQVSEIIYNNILTKKIKPGLKIYESHIQNELGFSRSTIRKGFDYLVSIGVLVYSKNQGVRVATPSKKDAIDIYFAREVIELSIIDLIIDKLVEKSSCEILEPMYEQILAEEEFAKSKQDSKHTKASCDFHLNLSSLSSNSYLSSSLKPLIPLSILIASIYDGHNNSHASFCSHQDHYDIIKSIENQDRVLAKSLMSKHLNACVTHLDFSKKIKKTTPLSHIFSEA